MIAWDKVPYTFFDGAHVFGSTRNGYVSTGDATVFSIAATKPVSAGEGGLIVTNQEKIYTDLRDVAFHGLFNSLDTRIKGINGKIQEFNSILAYHAINQFDQTKARRRELFEFYRAEFKHLPVRVWDVEEGVDPSVKDAVIFAESKGVRDELDSFVQSKRIGTKRYFEPAIPDMGSFNGIVHSADNARRLSDTCLTLPLYPALTDNEIDYIVQTVREFYGQ
jgi:dTDP-4-amino-4,6-dideoxygalactose transaminase